MNQQHTPEPWEVCAFGIGLHANNIPICQFHNKLGDDFPNCEANARRIVACVNACAGIPNEDLEMDNSAFIRVFNERNELVKQRDDLLAALNLWKLASDNAEESELDDMACYCMPMPLFCDADEATDAAIASAKGGA